MAKTPEAPEIPPGELAQALETDAPIQIVDVRAPQRLVAGRIEPVPESRFHNIVGSQLIRHRRLEDAGLDPALPIAVVCDHGNDSRALARHLNRLGGRARSLRGGMAAWMQLVLPRPVAAPPSLDRLVQLDRVGKGALGYALLSDGEALLVDPPLAADAYRRVVAEQGARLIGVADTHVHADYVSGAPALAREFRVPYHLHPADTVYPYDNRPGRLDVHPLVDGDRLAVGRCRVRVVHTPGHTEGSVTYVIDDAVALTGDFLFIASVGRPDLAGRTGDWTPQLWSSVVRARNEFPPDLAIRPAHYASDAERERDRSVGRPFARLLAENAAFQCRDGAAFARWVERQAGSFPESYRTIKAINVGLHPADSAEVEALEFGKNECALGGR
ncbi:MAG: MBL fold metallo-hydrolase [Gemmatimonadota bacterium]|nr:MBL fold metallo-hydrolase [Gemmatimonadota bacterium]